MNVVKMSDKFPNNELCMLEVQGNVATIHMNRSEVFNALNTQLITELIQNIQWTTDRSVSKNSCLRLGSCLKSPRTMEFTMLVCGSFTPLHFMQ